MSLKLYVPPIMPLLSLQYLNKAIEKSHKIDTVELEKKLAQAHVPISQSAHSTQYRLIKSHEGHYP